MRYRPEQHLRRQSEIRTVRAEGRRIDCRDFTIWWKRRDAPAADQAAHLSAAHASDDSRVCVVAAAAVVGGAVLRNRAKRRLREIFRQHQQAVPPRCDLMLIARPSVIDRPLPELAAKFTDACARMVRTADAKP